MIDLITLCLNYPPRLGSSLSWDEKCVLSTIMTAWILIS